MVKAKNLVLEKYSVLRSVVKVICVCDMISAGCIIIDIQNDYRIAHC